MSRYIIRLSRRTTLDMTIYGNYLKDLENLIYRGGEISKPQSAAADENFGIEVQR